MDLSIIILNYNTKELTIECLNSIVAQYESELKQQKFEIILIDNGSSDDSLQYFNKLKINSLKIIESKENLGFSRGCNLGAENAQGEYLLFLNSDTEIKDQGLVKMLNLFKTNKNIGILGGKLKNPNGLSQPSSGKFYNLFYLTLTLLGVERFGLLKTSPNKFYKVDWVSGASMMIAKSSFAKLKGFDKNIFMYLEDMDLCFRAKQKNINTYFYPDITLFHKKEGSSDRAFAVLNIYKGINIYYKKHKSNIEFLIARFMLKSKAVVLVVLGKIINNKYLQSTYMQALKI